MIIERDGKQIELTPQELYLAYEEYEHNMAVEIVTTRLHEYFDDEVYETLKDDKKFIEDVIDEYETYKGWGWDEPSALGEAVAVVKMKYKK